jgi:virulence factor Mce-like protein
MSLLDRRKPRRIPTRRDLALRGLVGILVAALLLALLFTYTGGSFSGRPTVTTSIDNIGASLVTGADVKARGVIVGKVTSLEAQQGRATLTLTLDKGELRGIPSNVVARVLPATVFGTSYVDLTVHGSQSPARLEAGDVIKQDTTQGTLEFQQALDDIDQLVKALGPAQFNAALGAVAQAVSGRGEQLGKTIDTVDSLLTRVNTEMPTIRKDVALLATNLEIVQRNAPELLQAASDGLTVARTIVEQQGQFQALLDGGLAVTRDAERFIARFGSQLTSAIQQTAVMVSAIYDNRTLGISGAFDANTYLSKRLPTALGPHGITLKAGLVNTGPGYYTSKDCPTYGTLRGRC